ncbi:hypothetical protein PR003_g29880 [Phytophthora rubi]|uniref:FAD-binding PCMH-type domain-containing protein n=1 Tax=Phytophthora rubi TaxID=129364 RepID=A0A6A4BG34_9STRA|nr:hypothetical protein PR003_g29880 [Phytophthora rubi]
MVASFASVSLALCSLIAAQRGLAAAVGSVDLGTCLTKAGIENSVPTTSTWTMDTQPWNARVNPVPSAVVFPKTEKEVSAALKCAADAGVKVTTLGGNRSFSSMGFGRNDGALIVNLKNIKVLKYDESTKLLTYGGPVMISEAASLMWNDYKRTLPHGRCPDVGMTGIASSGFATLSRHSGTVLDNIVGVRVALANGTIVDADAERNADLFWGDNVDALFGTQKWALSKENDDRLSIRYFFKTKSYMYGFFYGSNDEATAVLGSLMKNLPSGMVLKKNDFDFWASEEITTPGISSKGMSPRMYFYITSMTVRNDVPLDNSTAWAPHCTPTPLMPPICPTQPRPASLIYDLRSKVYNIPFADSSITTMRGNFYKFVDAYKAAGGTPGALITYRDERWTIGETAKFLYGGGNFERLQKIKTEYDPNEMFNTDPQAIPALST